METTNKPTLSVILANPRGFCAGVDRAIQIVEKALAKYGAPVYVRHEIVHNKFVVDSLKNKGAIFVDELSDIPAGDADRPVIFSAHGVPKSVPADAQSRNMFYLDATCPLVSKVHREAERHHKNGHRIILIGHAGHPEVIGTMGQLPKGSVDLIETVDDVARLEYAAGEKIAYVTQTTLSVDDTTDIIAALKDRFPDIDGPVKEDICYATTNRQEAVKDMAPKCDVVFVVGAPNSSNSNRLVEVAKSYGCPQAALVQNASEIPWALLKEGHTLGITAGASAPEVLIQGILDELNRIFDVSLETFTLREENITFKLPRELAA